jgi:predicted SnoaL-like aldol condensation-catalyzing enzyme
MQTNRFVAITGLAVLCIVSVVHAEVPPVATDELVATRNQRILPPQRITVSPAQQEANKRIVLQFHYEFFDLGHFKEAADKYLAAEFHVNDPQEPSGRDAYVDYFVKNIASNSSLQSMRDPANRPAIKAVLATDDLVMLIFDAQLPWPKGPEPMYRYISCDLFRLANGKIMESWFSGVPSVPAVNASP